MFAQQHIILGQGCLPFCIATQLPIFGGEKCTIEGVIEQIGLLERDSEREYNGCSFAHFAR